MISCRQNHDPRTLLVREEEWKTSSRMYFLHRTPKVSSIRPAGVTSFSTTLISGCSMYLGPELCKFPFLSVYSEREPDDDLAIAYVAGPFTGPRPTEEAPQPHAEPLLAPSIGRSNLREPDPAR